MTLAHSDGAVNTMSRRANVNQIEGIDSRLIWPDEISRLCHYLDMSDEPRYPILAALYHQPGGNYPARCSCLGICPSGGLARYSHTSTDYGYRYHYTKRKDNRSTNKPR